MISLKSLHKLYRVKGQAPVEALKGIDLTLPDTGFVFILGKSGSGKSTLLNVLGGLDSFDEGDLILFGKSAKTFTMKDYNSYRSEYVGFIFQEYNILPHQTVYENVALALQIQGKSPSEKDIEEILSKVGILDLKDRKPGQLSGGQKQRVAIARALVKKPKVILADEPTGALDSQNTKDIFDLLSELSRECLVVCVTHDGAYAERYADRIVRLKEGRIIGDYVKSREEKKTVAGSDNVYVLSKGLYEIPEPDKITGADLTAILESTKDVPGKAYYAYGETIRLPVDLIEGDDSEKIPYGFLERDPFLADKKEDTLSYKSGNSHLSLLTILKMGAENITHGITRLCITIVLSIMAFTMLGVVSAVSSFDASGAFASSQEIYSQHMTAITKVFRDDGEESTSGSQNMTEQDFAIVRERFEEALPSYRAIGASLSADLLATDFEGSDTYFRTALYTATALPSNYDFASLDYDIVGSLPKGKDEVLLTNYHYELFSRAGVRFADGDSLAASSFAPSDLVGKSLFLSSGGNASPFVVSGILMTELSGEDLEKAFTAENYNRDVISFASIVRNYYNYGPALTCYLTEEALRDETVRSTLMMNGSISFALVPSLESSSLKDIYGFAQETFPFADYDSALEENFVKKSYVPSTPVYTSLNGASFKNAFSTISLIGIYAAIALAVLSVLITMNYMFTSISFKKEEIGVLKGLGARSTDIFGIFAIQAVILGVFNFALASLLSFFVIGFLDGFLQNFFAIPLHLIGFNYVTALLLLLVSVLVALLAALIPSYSIASMKPVDAMKRGE